MGRQTCAAAARRIAIRPPPTKLWAGKMVGVSHLVTVPGGPHGIPWTHADLVNRELMSFIA